MEHLGVLRMYFSASEMRRADSWWKRIAPRTLGALLLKQAKDHGIEQALLHRVIGGYLKGQNLAMDTGEIPPARLPQCLELVGDEEDLQSFLKHNRDHLAKECGLSTWPRGRDRSGNRRRGARTDPGD
jgi:PII-like signaling protein